MANLSYAVGELLALATRMRRYAPSIATKLAPHKNSISTALYCMNRYEVWVTASDSSTALNLPSATNLPCLPPSYALIINTSRDVKPLEARDLIPVIFHMLRVLTGRQTMSCTR